MGQTQTDFLEKFKIAFSTKFENHKGGDWISGFTKANSSALEEINLKLRRDEKVKQNERFELGDLKIELPNHTIIVEHDKGGASLSNLVKFWLLLKGDLTIKQDPKKILLLCSFSDWRSYGVYRDLWEWTFKKIQVDTKHNGINKIEGQQFDKGGSKKVDLIDDSITKALTWIDGFKIIK